MVAAEYFPCLIRDSILARVGGVANYSAMLSGCLPVKKLSALVGVCTGPLGASSVIGVVGVRVSFAFSLTISSSISCCAYCNPIRVGVT